MKQKAKKRTAKWRETPKKASKLPPRPKTAKKSITVEAMEKALRKGGGLYADAARLLGVARQTVRDRVEASERLKKVVAETREELLDVAESALVRAIRKGNLGAICFYLKTQGRSRGYVERAELSGGDGQPLAIQFYLPRKEPLPIEDEPLATLPRTSDNAPEPPTSAG